MKHALFSVVLCICFLRASADHITGGEMFYAHIGSSGNNHSYSVTLKLFMRCGSGRQFPNPAIISTFDKGTGTRISDVTHFMSSQETIQLVPNDPCITDPPTICYEVAYYNFVVTLPASVSGYILASEVNFRIRGINNISSAQVGATYTAEIPGTIPSATGPTNSSAHFTGTDLVVVCADNYFEYSFRAADQNNDNLRYSFCPGYNSSSGGGMNNPAGQPPYQHLNYIGQFSSTAPLGPRVTINQNTGLISGIAPEPGIYVVTVCAEEIRDGQVIAVQRKDLQINITDCSIASARLEEDYMLCRDSRTLTTQNISNSPLIVSWNWSVTNAGGTVLFSSTNPIFNYTFPVNGKYTLKLVVNRGQPCSDSATAPVYVFPGMRTGFDFTGICYQKPTTFTDQTTLQTGSITRWSWDFGETQLFNDTSHLRNPTYTYPGTGNKRVLLTVWADNGCRDTAMRTVGIITKPPITLGFKDTLICRNDEVTLLASGTGIFSWSPSVQIQNANSPNPTVSPPVTTRYIATLNTDGCENTDSVLVRVVDFVTLQLMPDTVICSTDTIQLRVNSDGLQFYWTPEAQVITPGVGQPKVVTVSDTRYDVRAVIGGCFANSSVWVRTEPYPLVNAGNDTTICYNTPAFLQGNTNAATWRWTPAAMMTQSTQLFPAAYPPQNTNFVLTVSNPGTGCPKPVSDSVLVTVLPKIIPVVGNDTAVLVDQPLQLLASGGVRYAWEPAIFLNNSNIANPIATLYEAANNITFQVRVYNELGCYDTTSQEVKVYATPPTVFVPTAFTPNNDGKNDVLRPIAVGMQEIKRFQVYNRWGQLVFSTRINGHGWDGTVNGQPQASNSYVWFVEATDYLGKPYFLKGTVVLIR